MNWLHLGDILSSWIFIAFIAGIPLIGALRKVAVYEVFVVGAKEGFELGVRIIPYLVAIIVAVGMFRASGGFDLLANWFGPWLEKIGFPPQLLPLALIRPFSGSGANGTLADLAHTYGGHSFIAHAAATMMGSTETTFYVIAVYFGAVAIRRTRHAVVVGLTADLVGVTMAVVVTHLMYH
ncbi:MAG: spore maturation protein [Gammaproteobacteria bacterium]|nr:spore maturation protein [Gammaproteobacteria bacterium]